MNLISHDWVCKSALANSCKMELLVHSFKECASSISERNLLWRKLKRKFVKKNYKNLGTLSVYKLLMPAYHQSLDTCIFPLFY